MKMKMKTDKEVDVKVLVVDAGVRWWEDATVNGIREDEDDPTIPCKNGDRWVVHIDVEKGIILNWDKGVEADVYYKVCDDGVYTLLDEFGDIITSIESYVPECLSINDSGYGDYIIMTIDGDGKIENWVFTEDELILLKMIKLKDGRICKTLLENEEQVKVMDESFRRVWIGKDQIARKATRWERIKFQNPNCGLLQLGRAWLLDKKGWWLF